MTTAAAAATSQFAYPRGPLGYLTEGQADALEKMKGLVEERGIWRRGPPASHDDQTLLRYLRARRWNPQDALQQFKETEEWRAANQIDTLFRTIEVDAFEQSRRLYPQWTGRRDRRGIPLFVFDIKQLDPKTIAEHERPRPPAPSSSSSSSSSSNTRKSEDSGTKSVTPPPPSLLRLFALYEYFTRFTQPLCTQLPDRPHADVPITMSTNIVDVTGVGLKQFWNLKGHMQAASQLATAHYPETLDSIFVVGAPAFFGTVWGWIKRWFDPMTVSKIFVLAPHEVRPVLERFIDPANIPRKYGGELDFSFGQTASLGTDPAWEGVVEWEGVFTSFPPGPLLWEEEEDEKGDGRVGKRLVCLEAGSENGRLRGRRVCTVPKLWPPAEEASLHDSESTQTNGVTSEVFSAGAQTSSEASEADEALTSRPVEKMQLGEKNELYAAPRAAAMIA